MAGKIWTLINPVYIPDLNSKYITIYVFKHINWPIEKYHTQIHAENQHG